ncbi:MAG: RagB/SusD family nutrient uptake outer membrane protein, partial [Bacteroidota bacterium]|nr:RagB/SusD family nutrient uptake outer membrane protein [Bacteroidota bacterium]
MKNKFHLVAIALLILIIFITGCNKKPLDQNPTGQYTTGNFWRNQNDVLAAVNGIYNVLTTEDWVGHNLYIFDDQSDDISVQGDHPDFRAIERFNIDPTLQVLYTMWPFAYEEIGRANNAIIYIPKVPVIDDLIRQRSLGEAYFLRAFAYFELSKIYGEVPLILENNVLTGTYNVPKSSVDSVRAQIESDLLKAINLLPETYDDADKGRVSKGTALGLICKLYLFEDKFTEAIQYGNMVITNANYALAPNYSDNFTLGLQESNSELLFAVWSKNQQIPNVPASAISQYFTPRAWQGWGFHHPTQNFANEFETNDTIRKKATLLAVGDSIPNQTNLVTISSGDAFQMFTGMTGQMTGRLLPSMTTTGYYLRKYTAFLPDKSGGIDFDLKQPLMRTSEVYLLVAEAKIRLNGPGSGDAEINAVRARVGLPVVSGADMPQ